MILTGISLRKEVRILYYSVTVRETKAGLSTAPRHTGVGRKASRMSLESGNLLFPKLPRKGEILCIEGK